jgi:hypothetical protein
MHAAQQFIRELSTVRGNDDYTIIVREVHSHYSEVGV